MAMITIKLFEDILRGLTHEQKVVFLTKLLDDLQQEQQAKKERIENGPPDRRL